MTINQAPIELKDFMLESEMEQYLKENRYNILDEEQCTDSVAVVDTALEELGYDAYMLEGHGELDQTIIFIKSYQSTEQKNMKIIGVSTYQVLEEIADIALSVEFPIEVAEKHNLNAATVWVTYSLDGKFQHIELASEGNTVSFELTPPELKQVANYIQENGLKEELMKQIFHRQLTAAGEIGEHPLLDGYKRLGWVTEVYPILSPYGIELADNMYDYHIFENGTGDRLMLEHTSNNNVRFICEGTEEEVTSHLKSLFYDKDISSIPLESYTDSLGKNDQLETTINQMKEGLREILECTEGFYTADNGNRLDPSLSKFSGPINVMRKVAAELLMEYTHHNSEEKEIQTLDDNQMQCWLEQRGHKLFDPEKDKETNMDKLHRLAVSYGWKFNPDKYEWTK